VVAAGVGAGDPATAVVDKAATDGAVPLSGAADWSVRVLNRGAVSYPWFDANESWRVG